MKAFHARCLACGGVHVVWVGYGQLEGDIVKYAHRYGLDPCGEYVKHRLESSLTGLAHMDKWGPDGE